MFIRIKQRKASLISRYESTTLLLSANYINNFNSNLSVLKKKKKKSFKSILLRESGVGFR